MVGLVRPPPLPAPARAADRRRVVGRRPAGAGDRRGHRSPAGVRCRRRRAAQQRRSRPARDRGPPLGRRRHARFRDLHRPAGERRAGAAGAHLSRRRGRRQPPHAAGALRDRLQRAGALPAGAADRGRAGRADPRVVGRPRRAAPSHGRQPVLRHRDAGRPVGRASPLGGRGGARAAPPTCRATPAGPSTPRPSCPTASSCGCSTTWPETRRAGSMPASAPGCCAPAATVSSSATSSPAWLCSTPSPRPQRRRLHRSALAALERAVPPVDVARLAHHAEEAGDANAVLRFSPAGGRAAQAVGAHRAAAAHFARAVRTPTGSRRRNGRSSARPLRRRARRAGSPRRPSTPTTRPSNWHASAVTCAAKATCWCGCRAPWRPPAASPRPTPPPGGRAPRPARAERRAARRLLGDGDDAHARPGAGGGRQWGAVRSPWPPRSTTSATSRTRSCRTARRRSCAATTTPVSPGSGRRCRWRVGTGGSTGSRSGCCRSDRAPVRCGATTSRSPRSASASS